MKESTFVLDFRNETEEIVEAFEQFHGRTVAPPTDPNILWDTRRRLDDFDVLRPEEIEARCRATGPGSIRREASAESLCGARSGEGALRALEEEERLEFRDALNRFVRAYSFVSQIVAFTDTALERDYVFCRALSLYLRGSGTSSASTSATRLS